MILMAEQTKDGQGDEQNPSANGVLNGDVPLCSSIAFPNEESKGRK